jgi:DNA-binding transcriptional LysR family regulator
VLKINAPMTFGMLYLGSAVADFMARYPDLTIELTLNDRFIDPLEEGVDVTVRIGTLSRFQPDRAAPGAGPARAGGGAGVHRPPRRAEGAGRSGAAPLPELWPHQLAAALAADAGRQADQRAHRLRCAPTTAMCCAPPR